MLRTWSTVSIAELHGIVQSTLGARCVTMIPDDVLILMISSGAFLIGYIFGHAAGKAEGKVEALESGLILQRES